MTQVKELYEKLSPLSIQQFGPYIQSALPKRMSGLLQELGAGIGLNENSRVLDVGCGTGKLAQELNSKFGCIVHGIDFCDFNINFATQTFTKDRVSFSKHDLNQLHRIIGKYDAITSFESIGYTNNLNSFLMSCGGLLFPTGKLLVKTFVPTQPKQKIFTNNQIDCLGYSVWPLSTLLYYAEQNNFILKDFVEIPLEHCEPKEKNFYKQHGIVPNCEFAQEPMPVILLLQKQEDLL